MDQRLDRHPATVEVLGSNPSGATTHIGMWVSYLKSVATSSLGNIWKAALTDTVGEIWVRIPVCVRVNAFTVYTIGR